MESAKLVSMRFLFSLGRTSALAWQELSSVLMTLYPAAGLTRIHPEWALVDGLRLEDAVLLQVRLGGVIKIVSCDAIEEHAETAVLEGQVSNILTTLATSSRITFGIAEIGRDSLDALDHMRIKKTLEDTGISVRFVEGHRHGLSASVLLHQDVKEAVVLRIGEQVYLGHTIAVQNIDDWTRRDREKPAVDRKHGMLPPKVARMMLNIALPGDPTGKRVYDPFCGTGTVLLESLTVGAFAVGSDIRLDAVAQTQKNCDWLRSTQAISLPAHVFLSDATHVDRTLAAGPVDAIVTEGYLGPQTPRPGAVPNIMKGLSKLYRGAFKQWATILHPGATIVIALPRMQVKKTTHSLLPLIDSLVEYGYNKRSDSLIYDRPDAVVSREVFFLEYTGK